MSLDHLARFSKAHSAPLCSCRPTTGSRAGRPGWARRAHRASDGAAALDAACGFRPLLPVASNENSIQLFLSGAESAKFGRLAKATENSLSLGIVNA